MDSYHNTTTTRFSVTSVDREASRNQFSIKKEGGQPSFFEHINVKGRGIYKSLKTGKFVNQTAGVP